MTGKQAAKKVLEDAGKCLHYKEITRRMLDQGYWQTEGSTPWATINAQLATDIRDHGNNSTFVRTTPGTFGLREWDILGNEEDETYSFTDAAEVVLKSSDTKEPMHYRAITEEALQRGLITTSGKTPEASMYAQILQEIKRARARGDQPRFVKHGKGYVGLSEWMGKGLAFEVERHNRRVREELRKQLLKLSPDQFEQLVGTLLGALGFEKVEITARHSDGGIDVRGVLVTGGAIRTRMAVQAKKWQNNVQRPIVQQVRGSLGTHEQGLIITTSSFSEGARKEAELRDRKPVALMSGQQLAALLAEHGIAVEKNNVDILEIGDVEGIGQDEGSPAVSGST